MSDHTKCYVCIHVFEGSRFANLAVHDAEDWSLLCGEPHPDDPSYFRIVGLSHIVEKDPTLASILDLPIGWEAERAGFGKPWERRRLSSP